MGEGVLILGRRSTLDTRKGPSETWVRLGIRKISLGVEREAETGHGLSYFSGEFYTEKGWGKEEEVRRITLGSRKFRKAGLWEGGHSSP